MSASKKLSMDTEESLEALKRARRSLDGLSVGDAFGESFFGNPGVVHSRILARTEPARPWKWTDDTAMARVVVKILKQFKSLPPNELAKSFAAEYKRDPDRGYGVGAASILNDITSGVPWQSASSLAFGGTGSYGNGAAMRSAPIGAYFADNIEMLIEETVDSSQVTHFHPDGVSGAVAVALAAAWAAQETEVEMFDFILENLQAGALRRAIRRVSEFPRDEKPKVVAREMGNGGKVTALDTVPFCLWNANRCLHRTPDELTPPGLPGIFEEAMWSTVGVLGDRDTNCAIVGGIVATSPKVTIPRTWLKAREDL